MSEHIAVQKGKLVSSSGKNRKKKKKKEIGGGCGGVFLQIFNGKRLFSWKSLPEARPLDHADEKRPIAKLLLNADESIGRCEQRVSSEDDILKTEPKEDDFVVENEHEFSHGKKLPNLVARLMGLETMPPSPEPLLFNGKEMDLHTNDVDCNSLPKVLDSNEDSKSNILDTQPTRSKLKKSENDHSLEKKILFTPKDSLSCADKSKWIGSSRRPPHQLDSSFPSGSPSPKRGPNCNKDSLSVKRATNINERNLHQLLKVNQTRHVGLGRNIVSKPRNAAMLNTDKSKSRFGCVLTQTEEETKVRSRTRNTSNEMINKTDKTKSLLQELQRRYRYQQELTKRIDSELKKTRKGCDPHEEIRRRRSKQEETSRRLSQPSSRSMGTNKLRQSSSLKPKLVPTNTFGSSKAPRSLLSSNAIELSKIMRSCVESNTVPTIALSSSSVNGCLEQSEEGSNCIEQKIGANMALRESENVFDTASIAEYSNSEAVNCLQSSSTPVNNASEFIRNELMELSSHDDGDGAHVVGYDRVQARWENDDNSNGNGNGKGFGAKRVLDFVKADRSSCDSLSGDSGDMGRSLHAELDISSRTCDSVSHSGKNNVSVILHELLAALTSSKSGLESKKESYGKDLRIKCSEMISPQLSMDRQLREKAFGVDWGSENTLCNSSIDGGDQELDSLFEDSTCDNTIKSLGSKEAHNTWFKPNHSESMDYSNTPMQNTQVVDIDASEIAGINGRPAKEGRQCLLDATIDCDALLNTISRLHSIDPEAIGLIPRMPGYKNNHHNDKDYETTSSPSIGRTLSFLKPDDEMQSSEQAFSLSSTSVSANDEEETNNSCKAGGNTCQNEDALVQNKKLVSDCINEAFRSLGRQMYAISSFTNPSSASHVLSKVYKQIDDWKGMSIGMNLDDMVEKEMNTHIGGWHGHHDLGDEVEEGAEVIERTIFNRLIEEFILELM